jgi:ribonucleoside-triphosphate reductase
MYQKKEVIRVALIKQNIESKKLIEVYLKEDDWRVKENSNMAYSLQGLNNYLSSEITKDYWLNSIYDDEIRTSYLEGKIHIHDLSSMSIYCVGWDLYDFLESGFKGVEGKVQSGPPKHLSTALGQIVNLLYTLQGESSGAVGISNVDTLLAPFIYSDQLTREQVKQSLQEFIFNMNVPTRTGFQCPFSNITLDINVSQNYKHQPVLVGGVLKNKTYSEFQNEMNLFNECLFELMLEGDHSGRIFSFPIPTINITNDFNWQNPALENMWKATAKYGIPYFTNMVSSGLTEEDTRSFCCRLTLDLKELSKRVGGLFSSGSLTGSCGVCTVNLPQAAYLAKGDPQNFFHRVITQMELCKKSLELKRIFIEEQTKQGLFPYSKYYLRSVREKTGKYWSNHFSTIGVIGGNEACLNLIGKDITSPEGQDLISELLNKMKECLIKYQDETGNLYNLEAAPAEGASFRLARLDKKLYPEIVTAGTNEVPYYTNSTQLPVNTEKDLIEHLDLQDELQSKYTGGTVHHIYLGESQLDIESMKSFMKKIFGKYRIPYFSITPTFSVCANHGYMSGECYTCPICKVECEVYSRVVGYIRPIRQWNDGKLQEFKDRKVFRNFHSMDTEVETIYSISDDFKTEFSKESEVPHRESESLWI